MAEKNRGPDVNEMFQKMGERLGWFKHKNSNEETQLKTLSAKKTKMKNENGDHAFNSSNGKKESKLKLKKKNKIKANLAAEQIEKLVTLSRRNLPHAKAQSFKVILSSDSDSSLTSEPKQCEGGRRKAVLQVCSDSDDDPVLPARAKNHSDACVKESFLESERGTILQEFEPVLDIKPNPNSDIDWNDTVVKNRISLASLTLDLDNLGEPIVESTRIHRRSSVTYKQIIDSPDNSREDANDLCAEAAMENITTCEQEYFKYADKLTLLTSICEETQYVTAIETVNNTLNSSDSHENVEEPENSSTSDTEANQRTKFVAKGKLHLDDQSDQCDRDENTGFKSNRRKQSGSNSSDSCDEIEVMDAETQTDVYEVDEKDGVKPNSESNKVHKVYKEKTFVDNCGHMTDYNREYRIVNGVYGEDTVEYSCVSADFPCQPGPEDDFDLSDSKIGEKTKTACATETVDDLGARLASTTIQTSVNEYSKQTIGYEFESESVLKAEIYNEVTGSGNKSVFDQITDIKDSVNMYFENDVVLDEQINTEPKNSKIKYNDIAFDESISGKNEDETKADSEESMYEVCDAVTQTVEMESAMTVYVEKKSEQNQNKDKLCRDEFNEYQQYENSNLEEQNDFAEKEIGHEKENVDKANDSDVTESSKEESLVSIDNSSDNSDNVSTSIVQPKESYGRRQKTDEQKQSNTTEQSWRSERKYSSDSSSDGDLEAFFQKLRKPEEKKSDSSNSVSLQDFIVEDDDMTSDSEDSAFYLRETVEIENREESQICPVLGSDDESDDESDDFSSKIYPSSVTKHKRRKQANARKQTNVSWSFSSDSEEDKKAENVRQARKPAGSSKKNPVNDIQHKPLKTSWKNSHRLKIDVELSTDSDDEVFDVKTSKRGGETKRFGRDRKNESSTTTSVSDRVIHGPRKSEPDSAALDDGQALFKTPNFLRKKKTIFDDNKENEFKTPVCIKGKITQTPKSSTKPVYISLSDTDSNDDSSGYTVSLSDSSADSKISGTPTMLGKLSTPLLLKNTSTPRSAMLPTTYTFLKSLSNTVDNSRRHAEAKRFVNNFTKCREELSTYLFKLYNKTIFENKLPSDLPVVWNKRLLRTAGYCAYKKNAKNDKDRSTRIELSVKVCDNAERVRDTLIHELCHAAVWLLNGVNGGHGPYWKYWAKHATRIHPELPAISVCHSYAINTKFTYRCKNCSYSIGRHSKSLDVKKKVCGYCRGEFELIRNSVPTTPTSAVGSSSSSTPRLPSKFALFVKDNYNSVKRQNQKLKHGDVMKELSKLFAESKITS